MFALAMARLIRIDGMLSRTESIDGFHLKVSRTERGLYEEFRKTEEAEILAEMQQYFAQAKQQSGGIRFINSWREHALPRISVHSATCRTGALANFIDGFRNSKSPSGLGYPLQPQPADGSAGELSVSRNK